MLTRKPFWGDPIGLTREWGSPISFLRAIASVKGSRLNRYFTGTNSFEREPHLSRRTLNFMGVEC